MSKEFITYLAMPKPAGPDVPLNVPSVTLTMPVTWFPQHRGKVIGFINCGFGLSSTGVL